MTIMLFFACGEQYEQTLPYAPVYIKINLSTARDQPLGGVNSGVFYNKSNKLYEIEKMGYGGVYVYHTVNVGRQVYAAFDTACPVEKERSVTLFCSDEGKLKCVRCGSLFSILYGDGSPEEGVAVDRALRLQTYAVRVINEREMEIRN